MATTGLLYLFFTSEKTPKVITYMNSKPQTRVIILIIACAIAIILEGFVYREDIVSFLSKVPPHNLVVVENFNPVGIPDRYGLLIEFAVRRDNLDPIDITIDSGNVSPKYTWAWFDKPHMIFKTDKAIEIVDNTPTSFLKIYQTATMPYTFGFFGMPITPERSFYLRFSNPEPFMVQTVVFGGKHFHADGSRLILDNP